MPTPRSRLLDSENPAFYHVVSRCVRRSFLCGFDRLTNKDYEHRREWLEGRLLALTRCYAIELFGYAIMSNHFHLIVRYDPTAAASWTDEEVADRWVLATTCQSSLQEEELLATRESRSLVLLEDQESLARARSSLGSLSCFMKHLKQPIAWRANREDGCTGHFFESRFYSAALLDEPALIAALAYVDLNPVRAKIVSDAIKAQHTSFARRLSDAGDDEERLQAYLAPVESGIADDSGPPTQIGITLEAYIALLHTHTRQEEERTPDKRAKWYGRIAAFRLRQRAYGSARNLTRWAASRGWARVGIATV